MKVRPSVKKMCDKCKIVKRKAKKVICPNPTSSGRLKSSDRWRESQA